jgi:hypothetical protein
VGWFKHAQDFANALILGDLEVIGVPFLVFPGVPNQDAVGHDRYDKGVVDFAPIEDIDTAY